MKADVYYNLRKKCLSIRSREKDTYGRVVAHKANVCIKDPQFIVQPAGLKKTKETGVKNVHAFIRGTISNERILNDGEWVCVRYNPFTWDKFVAKVDGERYSPIERADYAVVCDKTITAKNVREF